MVFNEALVSVEDRDHVGSLIDTYLWVEICQDKKLILKRRLQEYEMNPSDLLGKAKAHKEALLYLVDFAKWKCGVLGLEDQMKQLSEICEGLGQKDTPHEETLEHAPSLYLR